MSLQEYRGKEVTIKSTSTTGKIKEVLMKKGSGGGLAVRFLVIDNAGAQHELMPHEIKFSV